MEDSKRYSIIANNYPSFQEIGSTNLNAFRYMSSRKNDDNAEGLWRVHDTLYDLSKFMKRHPGGAEWIELTKGTDITEAFEVHHLNFSLAEATLKKYRVREAKEPRNFKLTFDEDGFYRTLRRRVANALLTIDKKKAEQKSKLFIDILLVLTLITSAVAAKFPSNPLFVIPASVCMCYTIIAAHNFFHRRDNFRMYYFNLGFFNYKEWRISHSMSHHLYPNSLHDMEVSFFEPFLVWIPKPKSFAQRYFSWVYSPVIYSGLFLDQLVKRFAASLIYKKNFFRVNDLVSLSVPLSMILLGNSNILIVLRVWLEIILLASFLFGLIGLNAGHHHPDSLHDGDKLSDDLDWGIYSMDTVMDNTDLRKHHFLSLTHFGHHAMHHLFPTIDHGILEELYPVLFDTMREFEVDLEAYPWYHHIYGQLRQLARVEPNPLNSLQKLRKRQLEKKEASFE